MGGGDANASNNEYVKPKLQFIKFKFKLFPYIVC
jgi:hypothetical protein